MRIDGPQITGSFNLNGDGVQDLESLVTTSSLNTYTSSMATTMGHVMTATQSLNTFTSSTNSRIISIEGKTGSYATTGSNTFIGTQTIQGSIVPSLNNTYDLGSVGYNFRHLYLSSASLYIDGTKVLGSTTQELQITTDNGQSFKILEAGSDTITLQSNDGNITLATSGGGDVILDPTTGIIALKGTTQVYSGNKVRSSDGNNIVFGDGLTVSGSVTITGFIEAQELRTTYISSSILYRSGSTKFGDELTDTHAFTGSLLVSGSISVPGSGLVSGSSQILNGSGVWSGSAQLPSGVISGSAQVDVMSTTNIARLATTGSNVFTSNQIVSGSITTTGTIKSNGFWTDVSSLSYWGNGATTTAYGLLTWDTGYGKVAATTGNNLYLGANGGGTVGITIDTNNYIGINRTDPAFYLDVKANTANTFYTIAQFENKDYTSGTRTFIRVRNWLTAGGSYSSYFGQGQDGKTYIIANDSARGGDIVVDGSNGYIGINKSSPSRRLHLYDGSPSGGILSKFESGNSSGWLQLTSTSSSWQLGATANGFEIYNDGTSTTRVYVATTGEFGIGTSTLSQKFNVEGAGMFKSTGNAELTISSTGGASSSSYIQAWNPGANTFKNLLFYGNDIIFRAQSTSVEIERMRLTGTNGYLGLGTDTPQGTFHILRGSGAGAEVLVSYGSTSTRSEFVHNSSGGAINLRRESDGNTNTLFRAYGDSYLGAITGNFAIGTTSANGGRLTVQGTSNTFDVVMKIHKSSYADTGGHTALLGFGCESASWSRSAIGHTRTTSYDAGYFGIYVSNNSSDGSQITSSDLKVKVNRDGNVGIMDATYNASRLSVDSAVKIGRKIFGWYQATMPDGYTYYHMKTNLYGGGAGNSEYTMSLFTAEFYSYSGYIRTGTLGFHNWSGALYTVVTTGNAWATPYVSSDGYVVLVIATGGGSYLGLNVDWNQVFNYGYRDRYVTAASPSNSATGVY